MDPRFTIILLAMLASSRAADGPVPVVTEPFHKTVFENAYLRILDVRIPPAVTTQYHTHDVASVIVYLTKSTNASQTWGESGSSPRQTTPGDSRYAAYDEKALSHRVTNTGTSHFRVFDIELLRPAPAAGPFPLPPTAGIEPRWAEKRVRSLQVRLEPAATVSVSASACAHLLVSIDAAVAVRESGGGRADRQLKPQEYAFFPAQAGFQIRNAGGEKAQCVLLELK